MALLEVRDLSVTFAGGGRPVEAVRRVSFELDRGQTLAIVGESGSGKSVTALSLLQLLPYPLASHPNGSIRFDGQELVGRDDRFLRTIRGRRVGMIFQEPMTSLNPLHSVERQITEVLFVHRGLGRAEARARALELLRLVQIAEPETRLASFPHQLSGGQRQRVMIAMALANEPDILIADEPTTALDVTIQAQILQLLKELQARLGMAILLITHDLTIVRRFAQRVCVMTRGELVEAGEVAEVFDQPRHAYTRHLLAAAAQGRAAARRSRRRRGDGRGRAQGLVPDPARRAQAHGRPRQGGRRRVGGDARRADRGPGRRERLRQDHAGPGTPAAHRQPGRHRVRRPLDPGPLLARAAPVAPGDADRLPGPVRQPQPAPVGGPDRGRGAGAARDRRRCRRRGAAWWPRSSRRSGSTRPTRTATRTSSPAASASASRSPAPWSCDPRLVVLDEPTSALDMSVQAQIVDLLRDLQRRHGLAYLFISHDLRVIRAMSHEVVVMKDGVVVERGPTEQIFAAPQQPYTKALMAAAFRIEAVTGGGGGRVGGIGEPWLTPPACAPWRPGLGAGAD